jgi:membrane protease YdiL (CAAX protease family)
MLLINAAISTILQVTLLAGIPLLVYWLYQRRRFKLTFREAAKRAGLRIGDLRYLGYSAGFAFAISSVLVIWPPPLEPMSRPGSAQHQFAGLGLTATALVLALLNGAIQSAFADELLFRGLIAGSFSRKLPLRWANLAQAGIFLLPHFGILAVASELWGILPGVFVGALLFGWIRIKSGSILGSWLIHATGNVTMALLVASRIH